MNDDHLEMTLELKDHSTLPYSALWLSDNTDLEAEAWAGETGDDWARRNPTDVEGTNKSWRIRFGVDKVRAIREIIHRVPTDTTWLEVGCSAGAHMRCMQAAGYERIVGCDVNLPSLALCDAAVQADARSLPFADGAVDGVTTSGSLMHFGPLERMVDCLHEMTRVSREWLFFIELFHPTGQVVAFGELLPPAWVFPWGPWLEENLPDNWRMVKHRVINSYNGNSSHPVAMILVQKQ